MLRNLPSGLFVWIKEASCTKRFAEKSSDHTWLCLVGPAHLSHHDTTLPHRDDLPVVPRRQSSEGRTRGSGDREQQRSSEAWDTQRSSGTGTPK
ncbi:hypothetical protein AMECASPLE_022083 [Ameca splendens]|uniref:Uncharacterized protein n=1 Tax=Ameca splendens TaxID=208324 RepID=A0ABV0ZPM3_9TELE